MQRNDRSVLGASGALASDVWSGPNFVPVDAIAEIHHVKVSLPFACRASFGVWRRAHSASFVIAHSRFKGSSYRGAICMGHLLCDDCPLHNRVLHNCRDGARLTTEPPTAFSICTSLRRRTAERDTWIQLIDRRSVCRNGDCLRHGRLDWPAQRHSVSHDHVCIPRIDRHLYRVSGNADGNASDSRWRELFGICVEGDRAHFFYHNCSHIPAARHLSSVCRETHFYERYIQTSDRVFYNSTYLVPGDRTSVCCSLHWVDIDCG